MSFYGSVYYQLVDAFTKIVLGNKGINTNNKFGTGSTNLEGSQAIGRKGVFGFDTGNRWIVFDENTVTDEETGKDFTICEIYHNKPDTSKTQSLNGFKVLSDAEIKANTNPVTQLKYADTFETYETKYDNAGHIASSERKVYKLPVAEVNERVTTLENLVGTDEGRTLPTLTEVKDKNLYGYVEENTKDISTLEKNVGEWGPDVYNGYAGIDSICDLLGNFTKVLTNTTYVGYDEAKTLADILGSYPNLIKLNYDGTNPTNIIDSIIRGKNQLDVLSQKVTENKSNTDVQINGVAALIGNPIDNDSIYDHIGKLYDITDWDGKEDTIAEAIGALESSNANINISINDIKANINNINNNSISSINSSIESLQTRISNHEQNWNGTDTALRAKDAELEEKITQTLNTIGEVPADKTVLGLVDEKDTILNGLIEELRADLGSKTDKTNAFTAIEENAANISNINTSLSGIKDKIGEVGDKSLQIQINEIKDTYVKETEMAGYLEPYAKSESLSSYATKTELDDYLTTEVAEKTYATITSLGEVSSIIEDLGSPSDFKEEGQESVLKNIFDKLTDLTKDVATIKEDIINIKNVIDSLHPEDAPHFPDEGSNPIE